MTHFYTNQISNFSQEREELKKKIFWTGTARLVVALACLSMLWLYWNEGWAVRCATVAGFAIPFVALMIFHEKLFVRKAYTDEIIKLNNNELKGLSYDFSAFDGASECLDAQHAFCADLDLFGEQSFFQSINRTVTSVGKKRLAEWFRQPLTGRLSILERQEAIREMASKPVFRQDFYVTGVSQQGKDIPVENLASTLSSDKCKYLKDSILWRILIWMIPVVWLIVLAGSIWWTLPVSVSGMMFIISFLIANLNGKRIHLLHQKMDRMEKILLTYSNMIQSIENESFNADMLKNMQQQVSLSRDGKTASQEIKCLSRIIGALDQRFSLAGLLLNLFYLRDTRQAMLLEKWSRRNAEKLNHWFDALSVMDALCSLGGFAFNHPDYAYPEISDRFFCMEGVALGHPLLHRDKCVRNEVNISESPYFLVVTGANMAGKSTYLRTVGVNFWLACIGAPVCASSLTVSPAKLMTGLHTADSLTANESYFYAELKRLKMIIDCLNNGEKMFIILDEILKGTNSADKQKGSIALMRQLISKNTCGLIATHDLLLGTLEQEFPDHVRNCCFEADINGDELLFTYRLRNGVAKNMNAVFLMQKMGITV